jgi:hypothetical protein
VGRDDRRRDRTKRETIRRTGRDRSSAAYARET